MGDWGGFESTQEVPVTSATADKIRALIMVYIEAIF
jgi:hypothetical protein